MMLDSQSNAWNGVDRKGEWVMREIHKLSEHDNGRFSNVKNGYNSKEIKNPQELALKLPKLLISQDAEDRRDAERIIYLLSCTVYCPDGVWVCESEYLPEANGKRWSDQKIIWSAHLTKKEAEKWHSFWVSHWAEKRNHYGMLPVRQANKVKLSSLRHPEAKIKAWL